MNRVLESKKSPERKQSAIARLRQKQLELAKRGKVMESARYACRVMRLREPAVSC